jgi:hypothetical protein
MLETRKIEMKREREEEAEAARIRAAANAEANKNKVHLIDRIAMENRQQTEKNDPPAKLLPVRCFLFFLTNSLRFRPSSTVTTQQQSTTITKNWVLF